MSNQSPPTISTISTIPTTRTTSSWVNSLSLEEKIKFGYACPYCKQDSEMVDSKAVYLKSWGSIYLCKPCNAYVGVHKGTNCPKGSLANAELREKRKHAHAFFDPLWKEKMKREGCNKSTARDAAYNWLASQMNLPVLEAHIGMFDLEQCDRLIELCKPYYRKPG